MSAANAPSTVVPLPRSAPGGETPVAEPLATDGKLLSAVGEKWEASPEARRLLALTDQGLFVASSQRTNMHVLDYTERLRRNGISVRTYYVPLDQITTAYERQRISSAGRSVSMDSTAADEQRRIVQMLTEGVRDDVSDIHFIIKRDHCDVRYRILGELETRNGFTRDEGMRLVSSLYSSMCDVASQNFNPGVSQDARLKADYTESFGLYGARVATRPTDSGMLMVLRLLKADNRILTHKELGFLPQQIELFEHMASRSFGVNVISGPTGSGKSRTLQATMARIIQIDRGTSHVMTIEDPPEYQIPGAIQTPLKVTDRSDLAQVNQEWARSIANAMRLDPDTIMIGEMRDKGSANTAFAAGKTGHTVWTTLHANDATSIPKRLADIGVDQEDLTDPTLLTGITAQRLVPVLCEHCKIPLRAGVARLPKAVYRRLQLVTPANALESVSVRGDGCMHCHQRGITARAPVIEAIVPTVTFMDIFKSEGKLASRRYWVKEMDGITMNRHALHLVWKGMVDPVDAESVVPLDNDQHLLGTNYATQSQLA